MDTELRQRDYTDLHRYLRRFEMLAQKLQGAKALGNVEKVQFFLKGLKQDDARQLVPKLIDEETGEFADDWNTVVRVANSCMVQREAITHLESELSMKLKPETKRGD